MADNGINYLDLIKKGTNRDPSKEQAPRSQADPLAKYTSSSNSQRLDSFAPFNAKSEQSERDPLLLFQQKTQEVRRPSRPSSPIKGDPLPKLSPVKDDLRKPSPNRQQTWQTTETGFAQLQRPGDNSRAGFSREGGSRDGSRSPQRVFENSRDRQPSQSRPEQFPRQASERNDIRLTNPIQPSEYDQMSRSRQPSNLRASSHQNSGQTRDFDKFNTFYREQDNKRQSLKNTMVEFQRKSRDQLQQELQRLRDRKQINIVVFLAAILSVVLLFGFFYVRLVHRNPFCDTGKPSGSDCVKCPEYGICSGGKLTDCKAGYKVKGDICIRQAVNERLVYMMYNEVIEKLSRLRGEYLSGHLQVKQDMTTFEIESYLNNRFKDNEDFDRSAFDVTMKLTSGDNPDVVIEYSTGDGTRVRSANEIYSWPAVFKMFFSNYKYWLYFSMFVASVSCWFIWQINQEINLRRKAERLYKYVEGYVRGSSNNFVLEETLKRLLSREMSLGVTELSQIWPYIRYEASSRQRVDFVCKEESGIDQVGWWIDPQNAQK